MATYKVPFSLSQAQNGAQNIWTRDGQPVIFAGYNVDASTNEEVSVWVSNQPYSYPVDGRANGQTDDPLDLQMWTEDATYYINIFLVGGQFFTNFASVYATLVAAQAFNTLPNYYQSIPISVIVPVNI